MRLQLRLNKYIPNKHKFIGYKNFLFIFLLSFFSISITFAETNDTNSKLIEYLKEENVSLINANNAIKKEVLSRDITQSNLTILKHKSKTLLALTEAKIASLDSFLTNQRKIQQNYSSTLKKLQQVSLGKVESKIINERIKSIINLSEENEKTINLISDNLSLAVNYQNILLAKDRDLNLWQARIDEQEKILNLNKRIEVLDNARINNLRKNIELQKDKKIDENFADEVNNEAKKLLNNQAIILIQYRISELQIQKKLIKADYLLIRNQDVKTLQEVTDTYKSAINQSVSIEKSLKKMVDLLKREQLVITNSALKSNFSKIEKTAALRIVEIRKQEKDLELLYKSKLLELKNQLSARQSLTEYHLDSWPSIANQLILIPSKLYNQSKSLLIKVKDNYSVSNFGTVFVFWLSISLILISAILLRYLLRNVNFDSESSRLSRRLYDGLLILLYRNTPFLALVSIIIVTFLLNEIPYNNFSLFINLLLVWILFRSLITVARLMFLERIEDTSGYDAELYYRLKWLLLFGGFASTLMIFSHNLQLSLLLQDIFNRIFMMFILALSLVLWKSKDLIHFLLRPLLRAKKRYFRNAVSILIILAPLILLTTAIIGLVGYIHLAWNLSRYEAYSLILITSYILVRGLLFDALELLSEWMISSLHNGWLWIEVILKPLDKILRVSLFVIYIIILFQLFGWYYDSFVMDNVNRFVHYAFIDISGIHITVISSLKFCILLSVLIWASKWTREFCYRWLYRNTEDDGIRNSISVFTQYAVILIGGFITLRVLGFDFSGMSMILGGLAVGMGFGLRDFASNIIGGIMLLIERPVREGDLITIGEYEGRVAHIGIRSMRVSSWDNMEVLIPNAETFSKPFTNWTHQDDVVRTVVPIKVNRDDDPFKIEQLIFTVLQSIPEILKDPSPQVYLKQIDDALIEFEVRYYINIQLHTRFEIRSKALFAITAAFKEAGIKAPIPPYSVELHEVQ